MCNRLPPNNASPKVLPVADGDPAMTAISDHGRNINLVHSGTFFSTNFSMNKCRILAAR
jgi:hypothetical protein